MSIENHAEQPEETASSDPTGLPLFTTPPTTGGSTRGSSRGRRRGGFTLNQGTDEQSSHPPARGAAPVPEPGRGDNVVPLQTRDAGRSGWHGRSQDGLDWELVASLRQQTADRLSQEGTPTGEEDRGAQQERGRAIITELLGQEATERLRAGTEAWDIEEQHDLARAVFDAVFGLGRLQPLVDDPQVENIMIFGHDQVTVELTGGRQVTSPPVADSDQELVDFLAFVASRSEVNARPFSRSHPELHLRLDGGARLAAQAWVTPRPQVVIRRHRMTQVSLQDLVDLGALTPVAASFLAAVVRSGRSIVVSGAQGAGKTTMVRALCNEIPRYEVIGTFETEHELHLHQMPERHPYVFAWEARPGSGEVGPDGSRAGEYTLDQALHGSFRMNLNRQIVGEVRGPEAAAMLKAMQSGSGSISTTHAAHAVGAVEKLVTCVMESGQHATHDFALRAVASGVDVVVHVTKETLPAPDGSAQVSRFVSEIIAVALGEEQTGYAVTHVFKADPGSATARPYVLPDDYRDLTRFGFDLAGFTEAQEGTGA
ncbi:CpaF family protein [Ornithinimicrobium avium]|uniref:CpaF family protein n=1 Tax=Ornithinimicrobium avium TaxID=2283195 RepID=UPI001D17E326|nr:ATPase, T2SS/T4P/T4SS family [Ornithinimicrobium avium]